MEMKNNFLKRSVSSTKQACSGSGNMPEVIECEVKPRESAICVADLNNVTSTSVPSPPHKQQSGLPSPSPPHKQESGLPSLSPPHKQEYGLPCPPPPHKQQPGLPFPSIPSTASPLAPSTPDDKSNELILVQESVPYNTLKSFISESRVYSVFPIITAKSGRATVQLLTDNCNEIILVTTDLVNSLGSKLFRAETIRMLGLGDLTSGRSQ